MSFAIIETGGKQYKVAEGDVLSVEKLDGHKEGDTVTFDKVLLIDTGKETKVGTPHLTGNTVEATLQETGRGKKLHITKFKSKSRYLRRLGHRQPYSRVQITAIK